MNFRISMIAVLLLFLLCSCAQLFPNGRFWQNNNSQASESSQLNSSESEENEISAQKSDLALQESQESDISLTDAPLSEEEGIGSETVKIDKSAENIYPTKKAQPVLDDALELCQVSQDFWQKGELENAVDALDQAYSPLFSFLY